MTGVELSKEQKGFDPMTKLEMVKDALAQIGDVSAQEISEFVEKKHGVKIEPAYVPIIRAALNDKAWTNRTRKRNDPPEENKS